MAARMVHHCAWCERAKGEVNKWLMGYRVSKSLPFLALGGKYLLDGYTLGPWQVEFEDDEDVDALCGIDCALKQQAMSMEECAAEMLAKH